MVYKTSKMNSGPPYLSLTVDHLQLNVRAYNGCVAAGCNTIAAVIEGLKDGRLGVASLGKKTFAEVSSAARTIQSLTSSDGALDWDRFWQRRPIVGFRIGISTPDLDRLDPLERDKKLGVLHLKKARAGLEATGVLTVGNLVDAAKEGIGKLKNFGAAAHNEVVGALLALSKSVLPNGIVDWCGYAAERNFKLIPEAERDEISGKEALQLLPEVCREMILEQFGEREWQIFKRRLLAPKSKCATLKSLGIDYGYSKEYVRVLEEKCLEAIRLPLMESDYFGQPFRLRPELQQVFIAARKHLDSLKVSRGIGCRWGDELAALWQIPTSSISRYDRLLTEILDIGPYVWSFENSSN